MEAKTLKLLFDNGGLSTSRKPVAQRAEDSWTLSVAMKSGELKTVTRVRTNKAKIYKSVDAVLADVRKIGFDATEIRL